MKDKLYRQKTQTQSQNYDAQKKQPIYHSMTYS